MKKLPTLIRLPHLPANVIVPEAFRRPEQDAGDGFHLVRIAVVSERTEVAVEFSRRR